MRELGLAAVQPRAYKRTTVAGEDPFEPPGPDRPGLHHRPRAAHRVSGSSVTSPTCAPGEGWLYLATRDRPGHPDGRGVADGLPHAHLADRRRPTDGLGPAGTCSPARSFTPTAERNTPRRSFASSAKDNQVRTSVGRTGVCWDNAAAESFFASLKNEMYYRHRFATRARARFAVADYIEVFYNRQRLHSTLGYRTPPKPSTTTEPQQPLPDQLPRGKCVSAMAIERVTLVTNCLSVSPRGLETVVSRVVMWLSLPGDFSVAAAGGPGPCARWMSSIQQGVGLGAVRSWLVRISLRRAGKRGIAKCRR